MFEVSLNIGETAFAVDVLSQFIVSSLITVDRDVDRKAVAIHEIGYLGSQEGTVGRDMVVCMGTCFGGLDFGGINNLLNNWEIHQRLAAVKVVSVGTDPGKVLKNPSYDLSCRFRPHTRDWLLHVVEMTFVHITIRASQIATLRDVNHECRVASGLSKLSQDNFLVGAQKKARLDQCVDSLPNLCDGEPAADHLCHYFRARQRRHDRVEYEPIHTERRYDIERVNIEQEPISTTKEVVMFYRTE
jgi:hypothetical protein